jgi:hypothetical protein
MKLLRYISLTNCVSLTKLPDSIGQLPHLRFLNFVRTPINNSSCMPRALLQFFFRELRKINITKTTHKTKENN